MRDYNYYVILIGSNFYKTTATLILTTALTASTTLQQLSYMYTNNDETVPYLTVRNKPIGDPRANILQGSKSSFG